MQLDVTSSVQDVYFQLIQRHPSTSALLDMDICLRWWIQMRADREEASTQSVCSFSQLKRQQHTHNVKKCFFVRAPRETSTSRRERGSERQVERDTYSHRSILRETGSWNVSKGSKKSLKDTEKKKSMKALLSHNWLARKYNYSLLKVYKQ